MTCNDIQMKNIDFKVTIVMTCIKGRNNKFMCRSALKRKRRINMIYIIDSIMGSGKSTWIISQVNANPSRQYLIVVPLLSEVERYLSEISGIHPVEPKNKGASKLEDLKKLISEGKTIVTTHQLLQKVDTECMELLKKQNYTFIIDEALEVVEQYTISKDDFKAMVEGEYVSVDEKGFVVWNNDNPDKANYAGTRWKDIKTLCELHSLMAYTSKNGKAVSFIWNFPPEFFNCFKDGIILTYLWTGSLQKYYFELHNIAYETHTLMNNIMCPYSDTIAQKQIYNIAGLITIFEDEALNSIGNLVGKKRPLSSSWYKANKDTELMDKLKNNVYNFFKNKTKSKFRESMWSTFKDYQYRLRGAGYSGSQKNPCFIPINAKATNSYSHKINLAYLVDVYCDPILINFFSHHGLKVEQDSYALSQLLQWIWRSRIRNGEPIILYLPSERMRNLLKKYLGVEESDALQVPA